MIFDTLKLWMRSGPFLKNIYINKLEYDKRPQNIDVNRLMAQIFFDIGDEATSLIHLYEASRTGSVHPEIQKLEQRINYEKHFSSL